MLWSILAVNAALNAATVQRFSPLSLWAEGHVMEWENGLKLVEVDSNDVEA